MPLQHTPARPTKRLAIVARVSTDDQEEFGTSLDDQRDKGSLLGQLHDYRVDTRPYQEGGLLYSGDESGSLRPAHRPILQCLLADARAGKFDACCFTKIDRIARRLKYILEIWDALDEAGVIVLVIDPAIDTSTPIGQLIRNVLGSIAEFEAATLLERTMGGRRRKLARGELFLPRGKYGYHYTPIDRKMHTPGRVTIDKAEAMIVVRIYERRARGLSHQRIAMELTADGVPSPAGEDAWRAGTVGRILRDTSYRGDAAWGARRATHNERGKRAFPRRAGPDGRIAVSYPPIVTPELWEEAQRAGGAGRACVTRASVDTFLLRGGMVRCLHHRDPHGHPHAMTGSRLRSGYTRYFCVRQTPSGGRTAHGVPGLALDEVVWGRVREFLLKPAQGLAAARTLAAEAEADLEQAAGRRVQIAARLRELEAEGAWLLREGRKTGASGETLAASMAEVRAEQDRLAADDRTLAARITLAQEALPRSEQIAQICREFHDAVSVCDATPEEKRALLDALSVQVTMDGLDYTITGCVPALEQHGSLAMQTAPLSSRTDRMHRGRFSLAGTLPRAS